MEMNELYEKIVKKAWDDNAFKQKLVNDPKAVVGEMAGIELPDTVKVSVHESTSDNLYFVLPQNPDKVSAELSDSELDQVAGGKNDTIYTEKILIIQTPGGSITAK